MSSEEKSCSATFVLRTFVSDIRCSATFVLRTFVSDIRCSATFEHSNNLHGCYCLYCVPLGVSESTRAIFITGCAVRVVVNDKNNFQALFVLRTLASCALVCKTLVQRTIARSAHSHALVNLPLRYLHRQLFLLHPKIEIPRSLSCPL